MDLVTRHPQLLRESHSENLVGTRAASNGFSSWAVLWQISQHPTVLRLPEPRACSLAAP